MDVFAVLCGGEWVVVAGDVVWVGAVVVDYSVLEGVDPTRCYTIF